MTRRGPIQRPSRGAIVAANEALLARLGIPAGQADSVCWACGILCDGGPARAHVAASCHGGSAEPDNFFLLCDHCHEEQPDGAPRETQERWLLDAPHWGEWSGRVVAEVLGKVKTAAVRAGLTGDDVTQWLAGLSFDELGELGSHGYRSAGGHANGRSNCAARMTETFLGWAAPRRRSA